MKRKIIILLTLFLCVCSLQGCKKEVEEPIIEQEEVVGPVIEETSLSLIMAGDALIHSPVYSENYVDGVYDFTYPFSELKEIVEPYDLAYYNQETILGGSEYGLSTYPQFNSPQEVGDGFIDAGFNLVSLANNHTLDGIYSKGEGVIGSSCAYWNDKYDKYGIISAGSYSSQEDHDKIVIGNKNGISYALLSYTYGTNGLECPSDKPYLVNYIDKDIIKADVEKYRDKVDLLLVAIHWGREYTFKETEEQKDLANFLADLDVDIVIGNHAHVIEPIEWIDDTLVIYALGNIISAQYMTGSDMYSLGFGGIINGQNHTVETLTGMLASVNVTKTTIDGVSSIKIDDLKTQLIYTYTKDRYKIYPYSKLTDDILPNHNDYFNYFKDILSNGTEMNIQ